MGTKKAFPPALLILLALAAEAALVPPLASTGGNQGCSAVIEAVAPGLAGAKAGIKAGDVLYRWSVEPANPEASPGAAGSVFDWAHVEKEYSGRSAVVVFGLSGEREISWEIGPGEWGVTLRPELPAGLEEIVSKAITGPAAGAGELESEARSAKSGGDPALACWLCTKGAGKLAKAGNIEGAIKLATLAKEAADASHDAAARIEALDLLASLYRRKNSLPEAEKAYAEAVATCERSFGDGLHTALELSQLGKVRVARRSLDMAEQDHKQALAMRERLAPGSDLVADSFNSLGSIDFHRGDFESASTYFERALELRVKNGGEGQEAAKLLANLGAVASKLGNLAASQKYGKRALAIQERLDPGGLAHANTLNNLGLTAHKRGDLENAEIYHKKALEIRERLDPGGASVAGSLNNLAGVYEARGEAVLAADCYSKAVAIMEKIAPESLDLSACLWNLGVALQNKGEAAGGKRLKERAVAMERSLSPENPAVATNLLMMAEEEAKRGDMAGAERLARDAIDLLNRVAPDSIVMAEASLQIGNLHLKEGDRERARQSYGRALELAASLSPGSILEARVLHGLGELAILEGDKTGAIERFSSAIGSLERQVGMLGGAQEVRAGYRDKTAVFYIDCIGLLFSMGRLEEAFNVQERYRARVLLEMLAERDLDLSADLPEGLEERRRRLTMDCGQTAEMLGEATADKGRRDELAAKLAKIRAEQSALTAEIRSLSPRFGALEYQNPLTLDQVKGSIDQGTVLLSYCVGSRESYLFALSRDGFNAAKIDIGSDELGRKVKAFREQVTRLKAPGRGGAVLEASGVKLYDLLVGPADGIVSKGKRVLIVPDGPLHALPFGALCRTGKSGPRGHLAMWKPLIFAPSATIYCEVSHSERMAAGRRGDAVVFASGGTPGPGAKGEAVSDGEKPLAFAAQEAEEVRRALGEETLVFSGRSATKRRVIDMVQRADKVHFACHGSLDERFPLNSALVLSTEGTGGDDGRLQAWEVFESVRTSADLVVLSACETGLGREYAGEGLLGLVRAFQYAGASSVVATLWRVEDRSTSRFMADFYGRLKAGDPTALALRAAQEKAQRKGSPYSAPYFWAGFQLYGGWKSQAEVR